MAAFVLKDYQQRCLDVFGAYLRRAREIGAEPAYNERPERELKCRLHRRRLGLGCTAFTEGGSDLVASSLLQVADPRLVPRQRAGSAGLRRAARMASAARESD